MKREAAILTSYIIGCRNRHGGHKLLLHQTQPGRLQLSLSLAPPSTDSLLAGPSLGPHHSLLYCLPHIKIIITTTIIDNVVLDKDVDDQRQNLQPRIVTGLGHGPGTMTDLMHHVWLRVFRDIHGGEHARYGGPRSTLVYQFVGWDFESLDVLCLL